MPQRPTYRCPHCHSSARTLAREGKEPACYYCHGILQKVPKGFCTKCFKPIPAGWNKKVCPSC